MFRSGPLRTEGRMGLAAQSLLLWVPSKKFGPRDEGHISLASRKLGPAGNVLELVASPRTGNNRGTVYIPASNSCIGASRGLSLRSKAGPALRRRDRTNRGRSLEHERGWKRILEFVCDRLRHLVRVIPGSKNGTRSDSTFSKVSMDQLQYLCVDR